MTIAELKVQLAELQELNIKLSDTVVNEQQQVRELILSLKDTVKALNDTVAELTAQISEIDGIDLTETLDKLQDNVDAVSMLAENASVEP